MIAYEFHVLNVHQTHSKIGVCRGTAEVIGRLWALHRAINAPAQVVPAVMSPSSPFPVLRKLEEQNCSPRCYSRND